CRQFTCKYHGWRYGLDGALNFVQQQSEFFDLDTAEYGLSPVHCDVWNGFVFINLDTEPRQGLREFLGPMITGLDGYPFGKLTERYEWVAHNNSNWKIFADAFQEYYHVPSLHPQQVPPEVRDPNAGFTCGHFQLDGPHRLVSTAGRRRWLLPAEFMYPIERATKSGLVGPWRTPDIGELPPGLNPGGIEPWGISNFQIFPNTEILIYGGWYLLYRYWPTSYNTHRFEAYTYFHPARSVRERRTRGRRGGAQGICVAGCGHARRDAGRSGVRHRGRIPAQRPGNPGAPPAPRGRRLGQPISGRPP